MSEFGVHIYIAGKMFNPRLFSAGLPKDLAGSVHPVHGMVNGSKTVVGEFWKSKILHPTPDRVEIELIALLCEYREAILRAKKFGAERAYAEIECCASSQGSFRGYFISQELIALLFSLGMELDIDVVRKLKAKGRRNKC